MFFLLLFTSCLKEPQKPSWDLNILAPLFRTSLGIDSFLADSLLESDTAHLIHVVYDEVLFEYSPDSILEVPDTITSQVYQSPFNVTLQPGQLFLNKSEEKLYKFGDAKLKFINIQKGYISFEVSNSVQEAILMTYTIPLATKDGVSFEYTELIPAASSVPYVFSKKIDISGYTLDMRGANGLGANLIGTLLKARLNPNGSPTTITPQDYFVVNIKFDEFVLDYANGYFSQTAINLDDYSKMDVFNIIKSGNFNLESINIALDIVNGFGIDASLNIHEMASTNTLSGQSILLHAAVLGQYINIMRATQTADALAPVIPTVYTIDFDNTNVKELFENMPDRVSFIIDGTTNPMGNISGGNDFYYRGYGLQLKLRLDIPLSLKTNELTLIDTVKFNFENNNDKNKITKGSFKLSADNGFPFDALLQVFMLDSTNTLIDSMLFNNNILAAPLNTQNIVSQKRKTVMDVPLSSTKLDNLYNTKKMLVKVVFNTYNNSYLKIYDFYNIDLKLTGDFEFILQQ